MPRIIPASVPLLPVTLSFVAGILCGVMGWGLFLCIIAAVAIVSLLFFRQRYSAIIICGFVLGCFEAFLFIPREINDELVSHHLVMEGTVKEVRESDSGQRLEVEVNRAGDSIGELSGCRKSVISIFIPGFNPEVRQYDRLLFKGKPTAVVVRHDIEDELTYEDVLLGKRIYLSMTLSPDSIINVSEGRGLGLIMSGIRDDIRQKIMTSKLDVDSKLLLTALLTGDNNLMPQEQYDNFRNSGIAHILAVSGLHVAIIAFWINLFIWPFTALKFRSVRLIAVIIAVWIFTFLTGAAPSAVRASIFSTVIMAGSILQRKSSPFNSLCLAAIIILAVNPADLYSIGVQLSFAAVAGILAFASALNPVPRRNTVVYYLVSIVTVSIGATLGTAIITLYYFHTFPLYFIASNIIATLVLPIILGASVIAILLSWFEIEIIALNSVINWLSGSLYSISESISSLPGAYMDNLYVSVFAVLLYLATIILLRVLIDKGGRKVITAFICLSIVFMICLVWDNYAKREPAVYFLRNSMRTDILVDDGTSPCLTLSSTSKAPVFEDIMDNVRWRTRDYMGKRDIDSIFLSKGIPAMIVLPDGKKIKVESGMESEETGVGCDYLLVCRGYRGRIEELVAKWNPDTVILSSDLNPLRSARYRAEVGRPVVDLRERSFKIPISSNPSRK